MGTVSVLRSIALAFVAVNACVVLGLAAKTTAQEVAIVKLFSIAGYHLRVDAHAILPLVVSSITILTVPAMLLMGLIGKGAMICAVVVELIWFGILWILWLVTGALWASAHQLQLGMALVAFSLMNGLILFAYWILLSVCSIIGASRGHKIMLVTVAEAPFFAEPQWHRKKQGVELQMLDSRDVVVMFFVLSDSVAQLQLLYRESMALQDSARWLYRGLKA